MMINQIKLIIIDRDGLINVNSNNPASDLYYITKPENLILKDNVEEAFNNLAMMCRYNSWLVVLATRQRCIETGIVTYEEVQEINRHIDFKFDSIYIQPSGLDKTKTFKEILEDFNVSPELAVVIDDSKAEIIAAENLGMHTIHTNDLYFAVSVLDRNFNMEPPF